jgi:hypothetical protein
MGSTIRPSLQAQPININQPIEIKKISNKSMFSTSKMKERQKFRMGATRRNFQAQPKILKKLSEHQIYQSEQKFSQKKYV